VPRGEKAALRRFPLRRFLSTLGYRYWEESGHPAYRLFLA